MTTKLRLKDRLRFDVAYSTAIRLSRSPQARPSPEAWVPPPGAPP
jgi:hypothetical protein